ncbi:MAG: response regulator, partial [Victivallaceae bacterium]
MPDKIRVLAVDDAVANLAVIRGCLRGKDIELTTKTNALDALQVFKENFYDVLLLDVLMPGISGFELRKLIREIDKERPIIFFTSMIDDSNMTMLKQIAWDPYTFYLSKVTDKEILLKKIMEVTQANRMRRLDQMRSLKLEEELHLAGDLQKLMLPHWCVLTDEICAGSLYEPALLTSGDIFEFAKLSDGRMLFFIGDISGHGISAALYMSTIQT